MNVEFQIEDEKSLTDQVNGIKLLVLWHLVDAYLRRNAGSVTNAAADAQVLRGSFQRSMRQLGIKSRDYLPFNKNPFLGVPAPGQPDNRQDSPPPGLSRLRVGESGGGSGADYPGALTAGPTDPPDELRPWSPWWDIER